MTIDGGSISENSQTSISLSSDSSGSRNIFSSLSWWVHQTRPFPLTSKLTRPNKRRRKIEKNTLFPTLKCLISIRLSCHLFIRSLQILELWQAFFLHSSNLAYCFCLLTPADWRSNCFFPPLNCPMGSELKINWYTACFAIDQLVQCLFYQRLDGCSMCPECLGYHAIPSFSHGIHNLLQNVSDLLVRCFCLAIVLGMVWSSNPVVLLSTR